MDASRPTYAPGSQVALLAPDEQLYRLPPTARPVREQLAVRPRTRRSPGGRRDRLDLRLRRPAERCAAPAPLSSSPGAATAQRRGVWRRRTVRAWLPAAGR